MEMKKKLIAIDNGHGLETAGKRTPPLPVDVIINGAIVRRKGEYIHEKEYNRAVADKLIPALQRCGFDTLDVAEGVTDVSLAERYNAANRAKADIFISIHYNASGKNTFWNGGYSVVFVSQYAGDNSKRLASYINEEIANATAWRTEGVQADYKYMGINVAVLRNTTMPAALVEAGFMDVWEQAKLMLDPAFQSACAEALCKAVCRYFDAEYIEPKPVTDVIYALQLGAYTDFANAVNALNEIKGKGYNDAYIIVKNIKNQTYTEV